MRMTINEAVGQYGLEFLRGKAVREGRGYLYISDNCLDREISQRDAAEADSPGDPLNSRCPARFYGSKTPVPTDRTEMFWIYSNAELLDVVPGSQLEKIRLQEAVVRALSECGDVFTDAPEHAFEVARLRTLLSLAKELSPAGEAGVLPGRVLAGGRDLGPATCLADGRIKLEFDASELLAAGNAYCFEPVGSGESLELSLTESIDADRDGCLSVADDGHFRRVIAERIVKLARVDLAVAQEDEPNWLWTAVPSDNPWPMAAVVSADDESTVCPPVPLSVAVKMLAAPRGINLAREVVTLFSQAPAHEMTDATRALLEQAQDLLDVSLPRSQATFASVLGDIVARAGFVPAGEAGVFRHVAAQVELSVSDEPHSNRFELTTIGADATTGVGWAGQSVDELMAALPDWGIVVPPVAPAKPRVTQDTGPGLC